MKDEVLRLDRITFLEQGVTELSHFSLNVFAGEIMGLVPVNSTGLSALLALLRQNLSLHYGYVYYREKLVNHWLHADGTYNRIGVIEHRSGLADDLTVADNVFVLRQGFKKRVLHRRVLNRLLTPFLSEIGVEISANAYVKDLTALERFIVELVKAVVAGCGLIILNDVGSIVSDAELDRLHGILRHYAREGISFVYVSRHYEEIRCVCDRVALMFNGRIAKVLSTKETSPGMIHCFGVESFEEMVRSQERNRALDAEGEPALLADDLRFGAIDGLSFAIHKGECVVIQDLENHIFDDLLAVITGNSRPEGGTVFVSGRPRSLKNHRDVAVIQQLAARTMVFPELSYMDNLCFTLDHRLSKIWRDPRAKWSVRREYEAWLGDDVFDKSVDELTQMQKLDLIYARVLLQRPKVVLCVQPFMQADVEQRMHIWKLIEALLLKGIAVVILAVNLADTLSLADRLVQIRDGRVLAVYQRDEFGMLPDRAPWQHLWQGKQLG